MSILPPEPTIAILRALDLYEPLARWVAWLDRQLRRSPRLYRWLSS